MISHEKKLIFIHIPKTGGLTFSKFLRPYCDEESMLFSPYAAEHEMPLINATTGKPVAAGRLHAPLMEYYEWYGRRNISKYKVVTIVRNPWDRVLSLFMDQYRANQEGNETPFHSDTFKSFIRSPHEHSLEPHSHIYWFMQVRIGELTPLVTGGGFNRSNPIIENYVRKQWFTNPEYKLEFENLPEAAAGFFDQHGIKYDKNDLRTKTNSTRHKHYSNYYDGEAAHELAQTCQMDTLPGLLTPKGYYFEYPRRDDGVAPPFRTSASEG